MHKFSKQFYKLEILLSIVFVIFILSFLWFKWGGGVFTTKAELFGSPAVDLNNTKGYLWSDIAGWISATCDNDDCVSSNYGLHVVMEGDLSTNGGPFDAALYDKGAIVGHAWSSSIGWLSFDKAESGTPPNDLFPTKAYMAKVDFSSGPPYNVDGWGLFNSANGEGGWDGWLSLSCSTDGSCGVSNYQVTLDSSGVFDGFAWGGLGVAWVYFNSVNLASETPVVTPSNEYFSSLCTDNRLPTFEFVYDSLNSYDMASYNIELRRTSDNSLITSINNSVIRSPGSTISHTYNPSFDGPVLDRIAYDWSVTVTDVFGNSSANTPKAGSPDFTIESTKRPVVDFTWDPLVVVPDTDTLFSSTGVATCYDYVGGVDVSRDCSSLNGDSFSWSMPADVTYVSGSSLSADPVVQFSTSGSKTISLDITDSNSGMCSSSDNPLSQFNTNPLTIDKPIPVFEEKRP